MVDPVHIAGAGLAGSEAAWQLACRGIPTVIHEMRPGKASPAHKTAFCAELVCSNSLRSDDYLHNAVGLMHQEMRLAGSLIMECADETKVPAGGALAVDRNGFAQEVSRRLRNHPLISFVEEEISGLPGPEDGLWIIATYDKGDKYDYINCPLSKEEYYRFAEELLKGDKVEFHDFEKAAYFDGCLPIEVMAERGPDTLLFGPMKPVGLTNPHTPGQKPYAVVQLRQDNKEDTLRNMVGFQTKLKYGEQQRIFRMIPGLENAEFARLGGIHKNTFIKSPLLLDAFLRLKSRPNLRFAGQITGCEGYIESAAVGWLAGYFCACEALGKEALPPPETTAFGAMLGHLQDQTNIENFQPMNINFGIFPTISGERTANGKFRKIKGAERKEAYCRRALEDVQQWLNLL